MSDPTGRVRVGDRLERAIEERADLGEEIERAEQREPSRPSLRRTVFWLALMGVSLYLVAPSVLEVAGSWDDLDQIAPWWFAAMAALQLAAMASLWELQRLAIHVRAWRPVIASQLAGNALAKVAPGGGALGAALQYKMLVQAGVERTRAVAGLTAANLLVFAIVLALPVLAVPAIARGVVPRSLTEATLAGLGVFVVLFALAALLLVRDGALEWVGRTVQRVRNRLRRGSPPLTRLPQRLLRERDRILATLGPRWKRAVAATVGRWAFDYATLLAALAAVGSTPRWSLVLLAFCAAQLLAQVPATPGGLGFVEAGLTATLVLAGVGAGDAVLATFAYRLFTYWLPLPLGLLGAALHGSAYGTGRT
ncbi:MAG TPA: lysylphosphatidylglycerol synthase transmembrane domain-containing protein [Solirubrobacterales bacterium]|nr:lysylphosphatidylglycerol synthase transmembrane domain-containing protein [Solirubrobacterales bacterium]